MLLTCKCRYFMDRIRHKRILIYMVVEPGSIPSLVCSILLTRIMLIFCSIVLCMLICTETTWAALDLSQMNSLLSETIGTQSFSSATANVPSIARPTGGLFPRLRKIGTSFKPSIPQKDAISPSTAEVTSAIREIQTLAQKEAKIDRELFEQSKINSPP